MSARAPLYKRFPPGLGLLRVPTHSKRAALAGGIESDPESRRAAEEGAA
jgi:hypothetical protein